MIEELKARGIHHRELEAKVFGGSDMFRLAESRISRINVGAQNIRSTLAVLAEYSIHPRAADTGGYDGRKLFFISNTGEVLLKRVKRAEIGRTA
jgi:chemotaxis protein CheD